MSQRPWMFCAVAVFLQSQSAFGAGTSSDLSWLCIMDKVSGFTYEHGAWVTANLKAGKKFIVKKGPDTNGRIIHHWIEFGKSRGASCATQGVLLVCEDSAILVKFSTETLRFVWFQDGGYATGWDDNKDNPAIGIGTCTRL